jgi:hypothetical protein
MSNAIIASDWAVPRSSVAFTGYAGNPARDGQWAGGALVLAVTNTQVPCQQDGMDSQKFIQFTVLNIRKKGWIRAPWYVPMLALLFFFQI